MITLIMIISFIFGFITALAFINPHKSITYINPDWSLEEKFKLLEQKYWQDQNLIAEYDDENRKMRDREAIDENTRFSKKKIGN